MPLIAESRCRSFTPVVWCSLFWAARRRPSVRQKGVRVANPYTICAHLVPAREIDERLEGRHISPEGVSGLPATDPVGIANRIPPPPHHLPLATMP